jgi:hypothetical protein
MKERIEVLQNASKKYEIAAYKTHIHPPDLHVRANAKYIIGVRNFLDAIASLKSFVRNHGIHFKEMWGGFPPQAGTMPTATEDEDFEKYVLQDMGGGVGMMEIFLTKFVQTWWSYRKNKNVLLVHYADRLNDPRRETLRVAEFLNVTLAESELDHIVSHLSFEYMKTHSDRFKIAHILDVYKERGLVAENVEFIATHLVCEGPKRRGSTELNPRLVRKINEIVLEKFGPEISKWIQSGGPVPDMELSLH